VDLRTVGSYVPIQKQLIGFKNGRSFFFFFFYRAVEVKVKLNLEQAIKTRRETGCVALTARYKRNL